MKKMEKKRKKFIYFFFAVLVVCFLYLGGKVTYTAYESDVTGDVTEKVAQFKLLVNGKDVQHEKIVIDDIKWDSEHTRKGKISPGSCGFFEVDLNPSQSDVAILYKFSFVDKAVDNSKLILFKSITTSGAEIIRTGKTEYSGIITLDNIKNGQRPKIKVDFCYPDDGEDVPFVEDDGNLDDFFEIDFHAYQYLGEELVEYVES